MKEDFEDKNLVCRCCDRFCEELDDDDLCDECRNENLA